MNKLLAIGVGGAAVIAVLLLGPRLIGSLDSGGAGAGPPTATPVATAGPIPDSGPIEAGTHLMSDGESSIRVTIPPGWHAASNGTDIRKHREQPNEVIFWLFLPDINVYPDACETGDLPPGTGPTADDLVAALRTQESSDVSDPAATTIGGRPGVRLEISVPDGFDPAGCTDGILRIWSGTTGGNNLAFGGPAETAPVYVVETSSGRVVFGTGNQPEATDADLAELQSIVDSVQVEAAP